MALLRGRALRQAEKLASRGKVEEAIAEYHKVLARDPSDTSTLNRVGDLYVRLDRVDEAVKLFRRTAEHYAADGFLVKAIAIYKKILRIDPGQLAIYEDLADLYQRQGLRMDARAQFEILVDQLRKRGDLKRATEVYRRMLEVDPDRTSSRAKLIGLLEQQGRVDEALDETRELAAQLMERGRSEEACEVYCRALEFGAQSPRFVQAAVDHLAVAGASELVDRFQRAAAQYGTPVDVSDTPTAPPVRPAAPPEPEEGPEPEAAAEPPGTPSEAPEPAGPPSRRRPVSTVDREVAEFLDQLSGAQTVEPGRPVTESQEEPEIEILEVEGLEEPVTEVGAEPPAAPPPADIEAEVPAIEEEEAVPEVEPQAQPVEPPPHEEEVEAPLAASELTLEPPAESTEESGFFDLAAALEAELDAELPAGQEELLQRGDEQSMEAVIAGLKKGVSSMLKPEDFDTHYSLGIAYREMGLVDEAIGEFQLAAKDPRYLVECCGLLGACFQEKGLPELAVRWYQAALDAPELTDDQALGLRYELGQVYLEMGDQERAYDAFVEVYGRNSNFRDVSEKVAELSS